MTTTKIRTERATETLKRIESEFPEMAEMYGIRVHEENVEIHEPAFISVKGGKFRTETGSCTINIENNRVCVTLWKDIRIMHTTVFSKNFKE